MAKKKFYAVKSGKATGIFRTWEKCKSVVDGYPGAKYKGFSTMEEAERYLAGGQKEEASLPDRIVAYVDGSFDAKLGKYSFGCVILTPEGNIIREFGNGDNPQSLELRNVTGEMLGAMFAVKWCAVNGYPAIELCYDYKGIEMWATGGWRAKNDLTKKYAKFMIEHGRKMRITFRKIAAHTGDKYNEEADKLAKRGLVEGNGIPAIQKI